MQIVSETGKLEKLIMETPKEIKQKIQFPFQELGVEMEKAYGRKVWALFHHVDKPLWKMAEAFKIAKKKDNFEYPYLLGILKRL